MEDDYYRLLATRLRSRTNDGSVVRLDVPAPKKVRLSMSVEVDLEAWMSDYELRTESEARQGLKDYLTQAVSEHLGTLLYVADVRAV